MVAVIVQVQFNAHTLFGVLGILEAGRSQIKGLDADITEDFPHATRGDDAGEHLRLQIERGQVVVIVRRFLKPERRKILGHRLELKHTLVAIREDAVANLRIVFGRRLRRDDLGRGDAVARQTGQSRDESKQAQTRWHCPTP